MENYEALKLLVSYIQLDLHFEQRGIHLCSAHSFQNVSNLCPSTLKKLKCVEVIWTTPMQSIRTFFARYAMQTH